MTDVTVWAPHAERVEIAIGGDGMGRRPMEQEARGWWRIAADDLGAGVDYGFVLDGDGPFPDPRSPRQPSGIHGLSRMLDHQAFRWTDAGWRSPLLDDGLIYELHVGTFSPAGTFDGAIDRLDHLVALGVTHVELLPVASFPGRRGWGYDGVDLFAPHEAYGGPDGLKRLVDACHARGLAVLLDVVYNHLGPDGNYLARFGPYFSHRYTTPWGDAVNFDGPGSDEVRAFVIDNGRMWLRDYHLDGLRLDAVHEIFDQSAVHILEELPTALRAEAERLGRDFVVIAESDLNNPRLVDRPARGGYGLDASWNDDFRHALHVTLTGESDAYHGQYGGLRDLAAALDRVFVFDGRYSPFRNRRHGRPVPEAIPTTRFVGFLQNHDQTGNRACGERISHLVGTDGVLAGAAIVLLAPFVPLLFAGEEWAASTPFLYFTDHEDELLADAVRRGRRAEFAAFVPDTGDVPDPQDESTFERSRLRWEELTEPGHAVVLDWYRRLIAFRRDHPALRDGRRPVVRFDDQACWLSADRGGLVVAMNASAEPQAVPLEAVSGGRLALASSEGTRLEGATVALPPRAVAVVERDPRAP